MPPVGRSKKVGLRRVDAALDALLPLGFRKNVVINTVNRLLKVYGGDSGWAFIEEGSYKLVIETLLEDQEKDTFKINRFRDVAGKLEQLCAVRARTTMAHGTLNEFCAILVAMNLQRNELDYHSYCTLVQKDDSHKEKARDLSDSLTVGMTSKDPGDGPTSDDPRADLQSTDTKCLDQEKTHLDRELRVNLGSCSPRVQGENINWKDITCDDYPESYSLEMGQRYVARLEAELGLDIEERKATGKRKSCFGWLDEEDDTGDEILLLEAANVHPLHGTPDEGS